MASTIEREIFVSISKKLAQP